MNGNEAEQILQAIASLDDKVEKNQLDYRHLIIGNGNERAVLPRLRSLEMLMRTVPTWQRIGDKFLTPIITALITAGLMYAIFG